MIKLFVVLLLLTGCSEIDIGGSSINNRSYDQVQKVCPTMCRENDAEWTGLIRLKPETAVCICEPKDK